MATLAKLFAELGLDPKGFNAGADQAESRLKKLAGTFRKVGLGMTAALTGPGLLGGKALLNVAEDFDNLQDTIRIGTGKTGADLKALTDTALNVFKSIPTTMDDVGTALTDLQQRTGATGVALEDLTTRQLELARVTGTDLKVNIEATSKAFEQWGINVNDQSAYLDKLFRASQATGVPVATLADQLSQFGPILRQMGFSVDDSIAILGTLGKAGLDVGTVITGMRTAFAKFASEGVTDANAALNDVFTQIQNAPSDIAAGQIAIDTFGVRAGPGLADSIRKGRLSYQDLLDVVLNGNDTILEAAKSTNDWRENLQILRNRIAVAVLPLANKLFAFINEKGVPAITRLTDRFEAFSRWLANLSPKAKTLITVFAGILIAAGPVLVVIGTLMGSLAPAITAIGAVLGVLSLPLLAVIALVALLAIAWVKDWGHIRERTASAVKFVGKWLKILWIVIQPAITVIKQLGTYFHDVMTNKIQPGNLKKLPGWLRPIALILGRLIKTVRVFVKVWQDKGFYAALQTIPKQIRALGRAVAGLLDRMGLPHFADAVNRTFHDLAKLFGDTVKLVDDLVHGRWHRVWRDLGRIALDLVRLFIDRLIQLPALLLDVFDAIPWGKIGHLMKEGGKGAMRAIWNGLKSLTGWLIGKIVGWLPAIPGSIATVFGLLYDAGRDILSWVWTGIASLFGWLQINAHAIGNTVIAGVEELGQWFYNTGRDIVSGIWTGISSLGGWLYNMVWDFITNNIWNPTKKKLGLGSPSKLMMEVGRDTALGFALGIQRHAGLAASASSRMAAGAAVGTTPPTPSTASVPAAAMVARGGNGNGRAAAPIVFGERSVVVELRSGSREEANQAARYIVREVRRLQAGAA